MSWCFCTSKPPLGVVFHQLPNSQLRCSDPACVATCSGRQPRQASSKSEAWTRAMSVSKGVPIPGDGCFTGKMKAIYWENKVCSHIYYIFPKHQILGVAYLKRPRFLKENHWGVLECRRSFISVCEFSLGNGPI